LSDSQLALSIREIYCSVTVMGAEVELP
jgi:hypothetical protein